MKKRIIALALVLVLILGALAACGNKTEEPKNETPQNTPSTENQGKEEKPAEPTGNLKKTTTSQAENAIRVAMNSDLHTLDPHHYTLSNEGMIIDLMMDGLMVQDEDLNWQPHIATKMEANEDGTEVLVEIRDDVYFASGDKMEMEDILYSFEKCNLSTQIPYVYDNSSIEVIDETHFKWSFPTEGLSYNVLKDYANPMPIYNKSFCEQFSSDPTEDLLFNFDGTGPYMLAEPLTAGSHDVTLVRNPNAWEHPAIDKIYFKYMTGDYEMAFEAGDIDGSSYAPDTVDNARQFDNVSVYVNFSGYTYMLILNCQSEAFKDIKVREALQYGFDREVAGMVACNNNGEVAWSMFTPACKNWQDVVPHRTLDQDKARALMSEAGYSEANPCKITMFTMTSASWVATLEVLKEELDKCYFDCTIEEGAETTRYFSGDFDLSIIGINFANNFNSYGAMFQASSGLNLALYDGEDAEDLALEIMQARDAESAKKAMLDFDATMCYIPLSYVAVYSAYDANLDLGPYINGYNIRYMKWVN
ncbi:MAG: ABC transporter substrate-binding protein [Firmicutes bacterium]|nr:ABC transporter substrate-binding protein [Bacillota bacterium]